MLKIGFPKFINTFPLLYFLESISNVEIVFASPRVLNQKLRQGEIDGSLSSSVVYAKNWRDYVILPDISISTVGKVRSVILFHREELKNLSNKIIAISPETESSYLLLKVLLEEFLGVKPKYVYVEKKWMNLAYEEKKRFSGYLAIGDEALFLIGGEMDEFFATDLAKLWLDFTGLPFVFALLIIKKDIAFRFKEHFKDLCNAIYISRAKAFSHLDELLKKANFKISQEMLKKYFSCLEYDFSFLKQKAFLKFCEYLYKKKDIPELPELVFLDVF